MKARLLMGLMLPLLGACTMGRFSESPYGNEFSESLVNRVWVDVSAPHQCMRPAWKESQIPFLVQQFFAVRGITVYKVRYIDRIVCAGCDCPSPTEVKILVDKRYAPIILEMDLWADPRERIYDCEVDSCKAVEPGDSPDQGGAI
jgi:hypothetical protein